jgi:hypothetical protein
MVGAALVVSMPLPTIASAQGPMMFEGFAARKQQPVDLTLGGVGFTGYTGIFGLRLSGGLNVGRESSTNGPFRENSGLSVGGWTADADVLLEPFRRVPVVKSLLLGFSPYGFFGIGGYGLHQRSAPDSSVATLDYGLGAHHDLLGWLGVGVEARYRRPFGSDSTVTIGTSKSWEYRLGLTASFGGGSPWRHRSTPMRSDPPRPPVVERIYVAPAPTTRYIIEPSGTTKLASRLLSTADEYVGTKYRSGGTSPHSGFDGAGFVQWVFWREGIRLPRAARRMANLGDPVSTRYGEFRPGDLLFFANDGDHINHVAIYAGGDRIIHATSTGDGVRYDVLGVGDRGRWFAGHLVSARRITSNERFYDSYYDDDPGPADRAPRPNRW